MAYVQWLVNENLFRPVGPTSPSIPPGCYEIGCDHTGVFLVQKKIRNNELMRFPDTKSDAVIEEIQKFWDPKIRKKFEETKTPYKRGIMMYGPPGSGKTCALRLVMEDTIKRDGIVLEYQYPDDFVAAYRALRDIHPDRSIVCVMEDVEALQYRGGESNFINVLDGAHDLENIVFVATTNHPEKLGSRVFNRPSRFDKRFLIDMPSPAARKMFLEFKGIQGDELDTWVEDTDGLSIAHLAELVTATKILDEGYEEAIKVIRGMKQIPHSRLFDDSEIMMESKGNKPAYYDGRIQNGQWYMAAKRGNNRLIIESKDAKSRAEDKTSKTKQPIIIEGNNGMVQIPSGSEIIVKK